MAGVERAASQDALHATLDDGRVALASLDTVEPEPLPAGHRLYSHPRVRLSPYLYWSDPGTFDDLLAPFVENLHHYLAGEPLVDQVDRKLGY